ncbi:Spo0B domain-containing protein [Oceanobacillus sp. Castelsardo]|uniref:Spo0B domain-containing protein n=1 Tax=Oceanobacillus sp. Castelsardo TaxID=1851204 RepID=UPI000838DFC1|nr:Spo0B domain-containing protein [Oceanobacillus sp. Castelsardo]
MKDFEVVQLLQHYRHDLLNKLQLVQGYLSMGKTNKVEEKLEELFSFLNEERKLTVLQTPKFALWLIQFNHLYENFRITYTIDIENQNLEHLDEILLMKCKEFLQWAVEISRKDQLYEIELTIKETEDRQSIEINFFIDGLVNKSHTLNVTEENNNGNMYETEDGIVSRFITPKI